MHHDSKPRPKAHAQVRSSKLNSSKAQKFKSLKYVLDRAVDAASHCGQLALPLLQLKDLLQTYLFLLMSFEHNLKLFGYEKS